MTECPYRVPHYGPVTADCPVDCLKTVLSMKSFNPLTRADSLATGPPRKVADVIELCVRSQLHKINGLGPRRISEIQAALVLAGLDITRHPYPAGSADHETR